MSEEEKKAIESLRKNRGVSFAQADIILNLIDKQQVENEKLKDKNKTLESLLQGNLYEMYLYYKELTSKYQANCISKDTIRELIKEKAKTDTYNFKTVAVKDIEKLLEE